MPAASAMLTTASHSGSSAWRYRCMNPMSWPSTTMTNPSVLVGSEPSTIARYFGSSNFSIHHSNTCGVANHAAKTSKSSIASGRKSMCTRRSLPLGMNKLRLIFRPSPEHDEETWLDDYVQTIPVVDGVELLEAIADIEVSHGWRRMEHLGLPPEDLLLPSRHLLGAARTVPIFGCVCGDIDCDYVRV